MDEQPKQQKPEREQILKDIGRKIKSVREQIQDDKQDTQAEFAERLGISPGFLSQIESGKKAASIELLLDITDITGTDLSTLLTGEKRAQAPTGFGEAITFLTQAESLGVSAIESIRENALFRLKRFVSHITTDWNVYLTASSLKGLQQDPNNPFVSFLGDQRKKSSSNVGIQILFTHLGYAFSREQAEERSQGSIVHEVVDGICWAVEKWKLSEADIKFIKTPPTTFSIFIKSPNNGSIGLINPYPVVAQAFRSTCLVFETSGHELQSRYSGNPGQKIFEGLHRENFVQAFNHPKLAVSLSQGIRECRNCVAYEQYKADDTGSERLVFEKEQAMLLQKEAERLDNMLSKLWPDWVKK